MYPGAQDKIRPNGSAFLLLCLEPLHRARLGHGLNRLWLAALRGGFRLLVVWPARSCRARPGPR